ncbi:hypothetical protein FG379_000714 [Cryptosporidium bovis]|uniref:uncharacterized protein n=1 Tax=Cryptosporidium bovis TaxID=310047 RepID=UPI00351A4E5F|nr:hypothetical protein FG379_000714 [Cryptosporidium bovis]
MVKSRMTAVDICAMVHDISKDIKGQKLINIYDVNNRTYLFKFGGEEKKFLLVESGIRFHTTNWKRGCEQKTSVSSISFFNNKLRRYLRNKKLVDIAQIEMDRIVRLTFGFGENIFHLILEFFVAGNIILTDLNYNILVILRETCDLSTGRLYNFKISDNSILPTSMTPLMSNSSFSASESSARLNKLKEKKYLVEELKRIFHELEVDETKRRETKIDNQSLKKKNNKNRNGITTVDVLCSLLKFFNLSAIEELLKSEKISVHELFTESSIELYSDAFVRCISRSLGVLELLHDSPVKGSLVISLSSEDEVIEGDIILNKYREDKEYVTKGKSEKLYLSYTPYIDGNEWISVPQTIPKEGLIISRLTSRFSEAVDEFYSSMDIEREAKNAIQEQKVIYSKVDKVKIDQERRLNSLFLEREACIVRAKVMESHQELLDNIIQLLRHLIATGAQWQDIWNEIQQQKKNSHKLARYIKSIDLEHDKIRIYFSPEDLDLDVFNTIEQKKKGIEFDLFVSKSIQSNIRYKYDESKQLTKKYDKTKHAYKLALNKVSKIAKKDAEKALKGLNSTTPRIKKLRSLYWFEKFHWFISTDGFLVIGGHDASQNELLFRRYLEKNDRYIHADIHGAATCIVKNPNNLPEIPITTLNEAGQMSICYSKAWVNKTVISAWWVYPDQVSKTAPSGEYLSTGSFVIRGKKNYLPPLKLEMGCALYFLVKKVEDKLNVENDRALPINHLSDSDKIDSKFNINIKLEEASCLDDEHVNKKNHSNSTHVRFSVGDVSDVIPPLKIEHRVQFDELPPELLVSKPFNPLSIDETSNQTSSVNSIENITNLTSNIEINSDNSDESSAEKNIGNPGNTKCDYVTIEDHCLENELKLSTLTVPKSSSRRSSVDEGPPPSGFSVSTLPTPAELLSHKVEFPTTMSSSSEETIEYSSLNNLSKEQTSFNLGLKIDVSRESDKWIKSLDSSPSQRGLLKTENQANLTDSHDIFNHKVRENYRRRSIDGGPTPRGFIPDHVPSARELLQKIRFDPVDLELEHLSHLRERGRFISDAVPYLPEELQRLIMVSNQSTNKKHRFTIDTNVDLISRVDLKNSPEFNIKNITSNTYKFEKQEPAVEKASNDTLILNEQKLNGVDTSKNSVNPSNISRRKKSKLKKVAIKYKEQDEEERKIKMMLSGSREMKTSSSIHSEDCAIKQCSNSQVKPLHISIQEKKKKEQEKLERMYKDRNVDNSIENREFQAIKNCMLTTNDSIDSELSAIIPIFAPYTCVKSFKYCVKLTPGGNLKRSKAAQDIIHQFNSLSYKEKECNPESYEHIKTLKVDDLIKNIMNPVKTSSSMGNKSDPQIDDRVRA